MEFDKTQLEVINGTKDENQKALAEEFYRKLNQSVREKTYIFDNDYFNEPTPIAELRNLWEQYGLPIGRSGSPVKNENTIVQIFQMDPFFKDAMFYDKFQRSIFIKDYRDNEYRKMLDADAGIVLMNLQRNFGLSNVSMSMVQNALSIFAHINEKDELHEYLSSLKWDGVPRVEQFFPFYCGAKNKTYERTVGKNWWVSMAARALDPGCKVDNMVILEGKQGLKKSTMLKVIGGKWFSENTAEVGEKDFYQNLEGVLISEIAELDSFSKAGVTTIKRVLTSVQDKYRPAYGRNTVEFKRRNVFVGTTNDTEYLKDETGNRRFWPIHCTSIDLSLVERDRDQLFAEAVDLYRRGHKWWIESDVTHLVQESRRQVDPWEEQIAAWVSGRDEFKTSTLLQDCLKISVDKQHKGLSNRAGKILRNLGFEYTVRTSGRCWVFRK